MADLISILLQAKIEDGSIKNIKNQINEIKESIDGIKIKVDIDDNALKNIEELNRKINNVLDKSPKRFKIKDNSKDILKNISENINMANTSITELGTISSKTFRNAEGHVVKYSESVKQAGREVTRTFKDIEKTKLVGTVETDKSDEQIKKIKERIALFKKEQEIKAQNIEGRYKNLYDKDALFQYRQELQQLDAVTPNVTNKMEHMKLKLKEIETGAKNSSRAINAANKSSMSFSESLKLAAYKFGIWSAVTASYFAVLREIRSGIDTIISLDKEMVNLKKVTDETDEAYKQFATSVNKVAKEIGHTTDAAIRSTTEFAKLGYTLQESAKLAEEALIYSNIGDISIDDATDSIISTIKGFNLEIENTRHIIDAANEVGNNFAITTGGIGEALKRSSSTLYEANNTLEESIGLITAANTSIQNPERVGNALKTVSMRLRGIDEDNGRLIPKLRETIKLLTDVDIMKDEDTFKSTYDILHEISEVWKDLTDTSRATLLELMFGKHQGAVGASMLNNFNDAVGAAETAMNSAGSAAEEQAKYMESIEAKINKFSESLVMFWTHAINSQTIKDLVDSGTAIINILDTVTEKFGVMPGIVGIATVAMASFKKELALISSVAIDKTQKNIFDKFIFDGALPNLISKFHDEWAKLNAQTTLMNNSLGTTPNVLSKVSNGFIAMTSSINFSKISMLALNAAIGMGIGILISLATNALVKVINSKKELRQEIEQLTQAYKQNTKSNSENIQYLESISDEYRALANNTNKTKEESNRFYEIQNRLADISPSVIKGYDEQGRAIIDLKGNVSDLIEELKEKNRIENLKVAEKAPDAYKQMIGDVKKYQAELDSINAKIKKNIKSGSGSSDYFKGIEQLKKQLETLDQGSNIAKRITDKIQKLEEENRKLGIQAEILAGKIKDATNDFNPFLQSVINTDSRFEKLTDSTKNLVLELGLLPSLFNDMSDEQYVTTLANIAKIMDSAKGKSFVKDIEDLNSQFKNGSIDIDEHNKQINNLIKTLLKLFKIKLNKKQYNDIVNAIKDIFDLNAKPIEVEIRATNLKETQDKLADAYKEHRDEMMLLNQAVEEYNENGRFSQSTINALLEDHKEFISLLGDEGAMLDFVKEKQKEKSDVAVKEYNKILNGLEQHIRNMAGEYAKDVQNFAEAEKAKLTIALEMESKLNELRASLATNPTVAPWNIDKLVNPIEDDVNKTKSKVFAKIDEYERLATKSLESFTSGLKTAGTAAEKLEKQTKKTAKAVDMLAQAEKELNYALKKIDNQMNKVKKSSQEYRDMLSAKADLVRDHIKLLEQQASANNKVAESNKTVTKSMSGVASSVPYANIINEASVKYGIPANIIAAVIEKESSFRPNARPLDKSGKPLSSAKGLMQLIDGTARSMGVSDPFDPYQNIMGGTKYIRNLMNRFGSLEKALPHYFGSKSQSKNQAYMQDVLNRSKKYGTSLQEVSISDVDEPKYDTIDYLNKREDAKEMEYQFGMDWFESLHLERQEWIEEINQEIKSSQAVASVLKEDSAGYREELERQIVLLKEKQDRQHGFANLLRWEIENNKFSGEILAQNEQLVKDLGYEYMEAQKQLQELQQQLLNTDVAIFKSDVERRLSLGKDEKERFEHELAMLIQPDESADNKAKIDYEIEFAVINTELLDASKRSLADIEREIESTNFQMKNLLIQGVEPTNEAYRELVDLQNSLISSSRQYQQDIVKTQNTLDMQLINIDKQIENARKQIDDLLDARKFDRFQENIKRSGLALEAFANEVSLLNDKSNLLSEIDIVGRADTISQQVTASQEYLYQLRSEFEKFSRIMPETQQEADALASHLSSLSNEIKNAMINTVGYQKSLNKLKLDRLTKPFKDTNNILQRELSLVEHNIKMLEGGLLSGTDITFASDIIAPVVPRSAFEKERRENERILNEQRRYQEEILKIKKMHFEEEKNLQIEQQQEMLDHFIEMKDAIIEALRQNEEEKEKAQNEYRYDFTEDEKDFLQEVEDLYGKETRGIVEIMVRNFHNPVLTAQMTFQEKLIASINRSFIDLKRVAGDNLEDIEKMYSRAMALQDVKVSPPPKYHYDEPPEKELPINKTPKIVQVNPDGKAPSGLSVGDIVKTAGGDYKIIEVKPDGSYRSTLIRYEKGTKFHEGDEAVVGERGVEVGLLPNGHAVLLGQNGVEVVNLPRGTEVVPNDQINKRSIKNPTKYPSYAGGVGNFSDSIDTLADAIYKNAKITEKLADELERYKVARVKEYGDDKSFDFDKFIEAFDDYNKYTQLYKTGDKTAIESIVKSKDFQDYFHETYNPTKDFARIDYLKSVTDQMTFFTTQKPLTAEAMYDFLENNYYTFDQAKRQGIPEFQPGGDLYELRWRSWTIDMDKREKGYKKQDDLRIIQKTILDDPNFLDALGKFTSKNDWFKQEVERYIGSVYETVNIKLLNSLDLSGLPKEFQQFDLNNVQSVKQFAKFIDNFDHADLLVGDVKNIYKFMEGIDDDLKLSSTKIIEEYGKLFDNISDYFIKEIQKMGVAEDIKSQQGLIQGYHRFKDELTSEQLDIISKSIPEEYRKAFDNVADQIAYFTEGILDRIDKQTAKDIKMQAAIEREIREQQLANARAMRDSLEDNYRKAIRSGESADFLYELTQEIQEVYELEMSLSEQLKDAVARAYQFEFSLIDKKIDKINQAQSLLSKQLDIAEFLSPKDYEEILKLNNKVLEAEKRKTNQIEENIKELIKQRDALAVGSYEWNLINEKVDEYNSKLLESNEILLKQRNKILEVAFTSNIDEIEKDIFSGETEKEAKKKLDEKVKKHNEYLSGLEKEIEISKMRDFIRKNELDISEEQLAILESEDDIERKSFERLQKQLEIKRLEQKLENLRSQKTIQQLQKTAEGVWDFVYVVDQDEIDKVTEELKDKQLDLVKFEENLVLEREKQQLETRSEYLNELREITQKALKNEYEDVEKFNTDMEKLNSDFLSSLIKLEDESWQDISNNMQDNLRDMKVSYYDYVLEIEGLSEKLKNAFAESNLLKSFEISVSENNSNIAGFDTGGFTGRFKGGKLGVLHEKKLILNQKDTENILSAVKLTNNMMDKIRMPNIGSIAKNNNTTSTQQIFQISKLEFPNVKDGKDLQDALIGLPNRVLKQVRET